jgi:hypothetical protein
MASVDFAGGILEMYVPWKDGECSECGEPMKVLDMGLGIGNACKQCALLAKFERIAYALELQVGIE